MELWKRFGLDALPERRYDRKRAGLRGPGEPLSSRYTYTGSGVTIIAAMIPLRIRSRSCGLLASSPPKARTARSTASRLTAMVLGAGENEERTCDA